MLKNKNINTSSKLGFTIVEMLIIAPIVILTIGAFITAIVSMTGEVLATRSSNVLAFSIQDALNRIEEDVKLSTTFLANNNVTLSAGQGYSDGTSTNGFANANADANVGNMLILNTLVTIDNPLNPTSGLVYLAGKTAPCTASSAEIMQNVPMTMNVIYFIKNSKLWRRSVMPANYATVAARCGTPWQQPSCLPGNTAAFCKAQDVLLIDGIQPGDFTIQYFNTADATAANATASDSAAVDADRYAAMQSTTTVGATINITKTAAGREISQAGTIRSTKLDTNASTIAAVVNDTTPAAPTVTASFVAPDSARFSWPAVPGASSYGIEKKIGAGAWSSAGPDTTTTNYTVTATREDVVYGRVTAINSAGATISAVASVTIPPWNSLVFQNNWSDYGGSYATAGYTKSSDGLIVLKGMVKRSGTMVASEIVGTLPVGYRPSEHLIFQTSSNNAASRVNINTDGSIKIVIGNEAWLSLEGIKFLPSTSAYAFNPLTLVNGWVVNGGGYTVPAYATDGHGRIHIQGVARSGIATDGTTISTLPVGARPSHYEHTANVNSNVFGVTGLNSAGNVLAKGGGNTFLSLQAMTYPASYPNGTDCTTSWCTLTLQNSWVAYGGIFSPPRYTKSPDGMVALKGLIKSGTTSSGTIMGTLPAGYRPKSTLLTTVAASGAWGRIDIFADGSIVARTVSSGWTSLDNITFMAEQ